MKKVIIVSIILLLIAIVSGCVVQPTQKSIETSESSVVSNDFEVSSPPDTVIVSISETVLFEQEGIRVTVKEFVNDYNWGQGIKLLVENESDKNIGVQCEYTIVNNYMVSNMFSCEVAAGKKANEILYFTSTDLDRAEISEIGEINVSFNVFDSSTYMTDFKTEEITIKTSVYEEMAVVPIDSGKEVYNKNGVRIIAKHVEEDTLWGAGVALFIENTSDDALIIQCDDLSVNGFMLTPFFSCRVNSGRMALSEITLMSSELEENDIVSVDEIELTFSIIDADNYMTLDTSEVVTITTE